MSLEDIPEVPFVAPNELIRTVLMGMGVFVGVAFLVKVTDNFFEARAKKMGQEANLRHEGYMAGFNDATGKPT